MTKFACVCGEQIRISGAIPNPMEWHLIADTELDLLLPNGPLGPPDRPPFAGTSIETTSLLDTFRYVYLCPRCGGLWIFWQGLDADPTYYSVGQIPDGWWPNR